jgi:hypothetical protein
VFWYLPEKVVSEWERAIGILEALAVMAEALDSEPLIAILGDAIGRAALENSTAAGNFSRTSSDKRNR